MSTTLNWVVAVLLALAAALVQAAAPTAQTTQTHIAAGQPPTLTNFRINGGAAATSDRMLQLSWTLQGVATHWRVSTSPPFQNTPWNPLPLALPYKWLLPEDTTDGIVTLHMQLLNDHGQSAVSSAQIEYRAPPRVTAVDVALLNDPKHPYVVRVSATISGKVDRWRVTQNAAIDFKEWATLAAGASPTTQHIVTGVPAGGTATVWVHVQRDGVGQHSASRSFTLAVPRSDYVWTGNAFLDVATRRPGEPQVSKLTSGDGQCEHVIASGWAHSFRAGSASGPVRCRFTLFNGHRLGYAWALKGASVAYGQGTGQPPPTAFMRPGSECAIKELIPGGKAPKLAVEVYFPSSANAGEVSGSTYCTLTNVTLYGPSGLPSNADTLESQALTPAPPNLPNDP